MLSLSLLAAFEIARRFRDQIEGFRISNPEEVLRLPDVEMIGTGSRSTSSRITLNGAGEVIDAQTLTVGLLNASQCPIPVRPSPTDHGPGRGRYLRPTTIRRARSIPRDRTSRSRGQLMEVGDLLGIPVLDHLIISKKGHRSLKLAGVL